MAIQFELYKTPRPKGKEDEILYHARVVNFQHVDTEYLAREIQTATSLTMGDVKSVLSSLSQFMGNRLRDGERIHLDGIGYFQATLNAMEPIVSSKARANQMKFKVGINFRPDKELRKEMDVVHAQRTKLKLHSVSRSNDEIDRLLTEFFATRQIMTRSELQQLCKFTRITAMRHIKRLKEEQKIQNINTYYQPIYVPMPGCYGKPSLSFP